MADGIYADYKGKAVCIPHWAIDTPKVIAEFSPDAKVSIRHVGDYERILVDFNELSNFRETPNKRSVS